jgi:hypothetical protein
MRRVLGAALAVAMVLAMFAVSTTSAGAKSAQPALRGTALQVSYVGELPRLRQRASTSAAPRRFGADLAELPLLGHGPDDGEDAEAFPIEGWDIPSATDLAVSGTAPELVRSWEGSNHFDSRYSNGGNQFSGEPPDQGLCVGNGYVMETVNSVIQVYDTNGTPLIHGNPGVGTQAVGISLNEFYGVAPAFDRTRFKFGPFLFDVSCYYDEATGRWFHLADNLGQKRSTGAFTGRGELDLAVSKTSNPLGAWKFYSINTVNNGTGGTPNHHCDLGFCFADYPHIGADAHGIYLTTNEYSLFGDGYTGAQLYALSKADLVAGVNVPRAVYFQNLTVPELDQLGFTLRGAQSRASSFVAANEGTEYFVSSTAGDGSETGNTTGGSDKVVVWALTGTSSLSTAKNPSPALRHTVVTTLPYVFPPLALQKDGPTPLLDCINQGVDCIGDEAPFEQEGPYPLDGSDTRVLSSFFQGDLLWSTLGTALQGSGGSDYEEENQFAPDPIDQKVGVLYFALQPAWHDGALSATVAQQGYLGVDDGNLLYPSLAMADDTHAFIGASLVGPNDYPAAVYVPVTLGSDPTAVQVAAAGVGPDDGFTGTFEGDFQPRWGDYGYAVPGTGSDVWFAAEYIAQQCSFETFLADSTCGFTRSLFANWSTRVSLLRTQA